MDTNWNTIAKTNPEVTQNDKTLIETLPLEKNAKYSIHIKGANISLISDTPNLFTIFKLLEVTAKLNEMRITGN